MANLILSNCLPLMPIRFDKRNLVSLNASSYASSTLGLCVDYRITHGFNQKPERNPMRLARLLFEMEAVDKIPPVSVSLFFGQLFRV